MLLLCKHIGIRRWVQPVYGDIPLNTAYEEIGLLLAALKACSSCGDIELGKRIHEDTVVNGYVSDVYVGNSLVNMYAKCGSMVDSHKAFDTMVYRDAVSWNTLILGYATTGESELALELYEYMRREGYVPTSRTFVAALLACSSLASKEQGSRISGKIAKLSCLEKGMRIHSEAVQYGCDSIFLANTLVDMYAQCGSMRDAHAAFRKLQQPNVVSWNALILGYVENGEGEVALELFHQMQVENYEPNGRTYMAALMACASLAAREEPNGKLACLERGAAIHAQLTSAGFETDIFVASALVDMYSTCGSLEHAKHVFDKMLHRDVVLWNAMVQGCADNREYEMALEMFSRMVKERVSPDTLTYVAVLTACAGLATKEPGNVKVKCLESGMAIHSQAVNSRHALKFFVASNLLVMYAKCGSMLDARMVFDTMPFHDVVCWTALLLGYVETDESELALRLFSCMSSEPSARTFVSAFMACGSLAAREEGLDIGGKLVKLKCLEEGMILHSEAAKFEFDSDIFVASILIDMYAKCGSMVNARLVFDKMLLHDTVSWTALLQGYVENGEAEVALELFDCMLSRGLAVDIRTCSSALSCCASLAAATTEIDGNEKQANIGFLEKVMNIHSIAMECTGFESDLFMANALIDAYGKSGSLLDARMVFDRMAFHDVVSWNTALQGHAENGQSHVALELFQYASSPDERTYSNVLIACSNLSALEVGKDICTSICRQGLENELYLAVSVLGFYSKCGSMFNAEHVFSSIQSATKSVMWSSLITGYSKQGAYKKVFTSLQQMLSEGVQADSITYLAVLTACSHAGLIEKGKQYFEKMGTKADMRHFHCMIDMFGRANLMEDALRMVESMPRQPTVVTWTIVLGACHKWKNAHVGKVAFDSLLKLDARYASAYSLMANTYSV